MKSTNQIYETMNAGAKIGALILAVIAFAAVWETDSKRRTEWIAQRNRTNPRVILANKHREAERQRRELARREHANPAAFRLAQRYSKYKHPQLVIENDEVAAPVVTHDPKESRPSEPARQIVKNASTTSASNFWSNLRLPSDIQPGSYRVVDTRGNVNNLQLGVGNSESENRRKLYSVESGGVTTYFIRIDADAQDVEKTASSNAGNLK